MEEKIYKRQVTKLSLACRVVDEQQIERHYSNHNLAELYSFDPSEPDGKTLNCPKDRLLAEMFLKYPNAVKDYLEHDSLLENKVKLAHLIWFIYLCFFFSILLYDFIEISFVFFSFIFRRMKS